MSEQEDGPGRPEERGRERGLGDEGGADAGGSGEGELSRSDAGAVGEPCDRASKSRAGGAAGDGAGGHGGRGAELAGSGEGEAGGSGGGSVGEQGRSGLPGERGDRDAELAGSGGSGVGELSRSGLPSRASIAAAVLGPVLLTVAYFTLPFAPIGGGHRAVRWVVLVGLLVVLAAGMVLTTARALTDPGGRPGVGILLLAWASILVFAACYWSLAANRGEFVGLSTRLDALYFTGVTMATVGYGDIHPVGQLGRAVVLVQLVYSFAFLAGGVAALGTRTRARIVRRVGR
jgi:voltage-gated potassium channel